MIKITCSQYEIEELSNWESYASKIEKLLLHAKKVETNILLLPEYAGIEITGKKFQTDRELFEALQSFIPKYIEFYRQLAKKYQLYIQAGTIIEKINQDHFVNRAYLFSPNGSYDFQDKLQLTEYEKNLNLIEQGIHQKIFDTPFGKIGIAICYDSEFPALIQGLVHQGATLILVPSYTTTLAGYNRVFLSCRARAIENQCYIAISYVIKKVDLSGDFDNTYGQAAILGPVDTGFPDDGIIAQGKMNQSMLITSQVSLEDLVRVRKKGQVHNFEDSLRIKQDKKDIKMIPF